MKKLVAWAIVLILCLSISGCSDSNEFSKQRTHKKEEDKAKFYGFEWLTTKEEVDKKFDEDFGSGNYRIEANRYSTPVGEDKGLYFYSYLPNEEDGVLTTVGGCEVKEIWLEFICYNKDYPNNENSMYLYEAKYEFANPTRNRADKLDDILKNQYKILDREAKNSSGDLKTKYTDNNNNDVELEYSGEYTSPALSEDDVSLHFDARLEITYECMDIKEYINREQGNTKKESSQGL